MILQPARASTGLANPRGAKLPLYVSNGREGRIRTSGVHHMGHGFTARCVQPLRIPHACASALGSGGRTRTCDHLINGEALYHSATPEPNAARVRHITHQLSKIKNRGPVLLARGRSLSSVNPTQSRRPRGPGYCQGSSTSMRAATSRSPNEGRARNSMTGCESCASDCLSVSDGAYYSIKLDRLSTRRMINYK